MHLYIKPSLILMLFMIVFVAGCTQSEEKVLNDAETSAQTIFNDQEAIEANYTDDTISFYLPDYLDIVEVEKNNIILESKHSTYIIFYNDLEQRTSQFHYESSDHEAALVYTAFENDDQFGYIRILEPNVNDQYELQIGIGGVKITTYSSLKEIKNEAKYLMKIAQSIIDQNE